MIEPMSVEKIKELIPGLPKEGHVLRLILAWAHAEARARQASLPTWSTSTEKLDYSKTDWLNEVLDEIGWPKDR